MTNIYDLLGDSANGAGALHFLPEGGRVPLEVVWTRAQRAGAALARRAGTGGSIGIVLDSTAAAVTSLFAIWASGNAAVSLPHRAPGQTAGAWVGQLRTMCDRAGVELTLIPDGLSRQVDGAPLAVLGHEVAADDDGPGAAPGGPGDLVQFTSGSTSAPRGVRLGGAALAANVLALRETVWLGEGDADLTVSWLPLSHDMGLVGMLLVPVVASAPRFGARGAVLMPPEYFIRDPARWLRACADLRATVTTVPNFALDLGARAASRLGDADLSSLRLCIVGAERVRADSLEAFTTGLAGHGVHKSIMSPAYGLAENTLAVTMVRPDETWRSVATARHIPDLGNATAGVVSNGRPLPGVEVRLHNPINGVGEIELRSPALLSGYLGEPSPLTDDGWFRTKDIGALDDGELLVFGRADEVINSAGRLIFPVDLEVAAESAAGLCVRSAAVQWGTGFAMIAEAEHAGRADRVAATEITRVISQATGLAPTAVFFIPRNTLPRTTSGKIRRHEAARNIRENTLRILYQSTGAN